MNPETKLTPHFTLGELCCSKQHPEIKNEPPTEVIDNLVCVCQWLELLRKAYNEMYTSPNPSEGGEKSSSPSGRLGEVPIIINSGYRSKMLNYAVGGVSDSNHLTGCAVDIACPGKDGTERCKMAIRYAWILLEIFEEHKKPWDEIIIERKGTKFWVHFAVFPEGSKKKGRRKLLVLNA